MSAHSLLLDDLLTPILGPHPAGADLRYDAVYDEIKRARKAAEAEGAKMSAWDALYDLLAGTLRSKSKDLQLAVWLLEPMVHRDGFVGAAVGFQLIQRLLSEYWDTLFPPIESDEDEPLQFRAGQLSWLDGKLPQQLKSRPLTDRSKRYSAVHYDASQETNPEKKKALAENWPTLQQFDAEMDETSADFLDQTRLEVAQSRSALTKLEQACGKLFGPDVTFGHTRRALESCAWLLDRTVKRREARDPSPNIAGGAIDGAALEQEAAPSAPQPATPSEMHAPACDADQLRRIIEALREDNSCSPLPYLLARAVACGKLAEFSTIAEAHPLPAPETATRQRLKALLIGENWSELLTESERAICAVDKQAWMDPYRYSIVAMEKLSGFESALQVARAQLTTLLAMFPDIATAELEDGTPAAGRDTEQWLRAQFSPAQTAPIATGPTPVLAQNAYPVERGANADGKDDHAEEVQSLVRAGRLREAVTVLQSRVSAAASGRQRFISRLRLAEICLETGNAALAYPILEELSSTIEASHLETWEDRELIATVWLALYRACQQLEGQDADVKVRAREAFAKLCRIDPARAMTLERDALQSRRLRR